MATQIRQLRGTAAENDAYTAQSGVLTIDETAGDIRVHDGQTLGGLPILGRVTELVGIVFDSIAAFRTATVRPGVDRIQVLGYYGRSSRGGGTFYRDTSDNSTADNGGYCIVKGGVRWKRIPSESVSVDQFGARGDGVADDTSAIQAATTYCAANKALLFIPDGRYRLTAKITGTGEIAIRGAGRATTILVWDDAATSSGLEFTLASNSGLSTTCQISSLSLTTRSTAAAGIALSVVGPSSVSSDRITGRLIVRDIAIRGDRHPVTDGWGRGILLSNITNGLIDSFVFWGKIGSGGQPSYDSLYAIQYVSGGFTPHHCGITIDHCYIAYARNAIELNDFEGGLIDNCQILGVNTGVSFIGPDVYPHGSVQNTHIAADTTCILVDRMYEVFVSNCLLYLQLGTNVGQMIQVRNGARYASITSNTFENYKSAQQANCVIVDGSTMCLITGNVFRRSNSISGAATGIGVWLTPSSASCRVSNNLFDATGTNVLNQGTGNTVA